MQEILIHYHLFAVTIKQLLTQKTTLLVQNVAMASVEFNKILDGFETLRQLLISIQISLSIAGTPHIESIQFILGSYIIICPVGFSLVVYSDITGQPP